MHDFDFEVGEWRVHHRVSRTGGERWLEFEGTCRNRGLIDGFANVEEHAFNKPTGVTHGVALRAYDPETALWAVWWIDGRDIYASLDPPVKGHFENGVRTFYSDSTVDGKTIRTRFVWSHITRTSARWEQVYSSDSGKTWETKWIMDFRRLRRARSVAWLVYAIQLHELDGTAINCDCRSRLSYPLPPRTN